MSRESTRSGKRKRRPKRPSDTPAPPAARAATQSDEKPPPSGRPPEAEAAKPDETSGTNQADLFDLPTRSVETPPAKPATVSDDAEPQSRQRKSILKRRRRDEEVAARALGQAATPPPREGSEPRPETATTEQSPEVDPPSRALAQTAAKPVEKRPGEHAVDRAGAELKAPKPKTADAAHPGPIEIGTSAPESSARSAEGTVGRVLLSLFLGLVRLGVATGLVIGIIGVTSYLVMQAYVGGKEVDVPVLLGSTLDEALEKLQPGQLYLELEQPGGHVYSDEVSRGRIVAQFPAPHTTVKARTPVRIVVSDGPHLKRAPSLVGLTELVAGVTLRQEPDAELDVGQRCFVYWPGSKKGDVIGQDPPPDTPIRRDGRIDLLISLGPPPVYYPMPDLREKTIQEARIALGEMHLTITDVREIDRPGYRRGIVVSHEPRPGDRVSPTTPIIVTIATGLAGRP